MGFVVHGFVSELQYVAEEVDDPRVTRIVRRLQRPTSATVVGRAGVGRNSVAAALCGRGIDVRSDGDVCVLVVVEAVKPEDLAAARSTRRPVLIVLTKADLSGVGPGGPMAVARGRATAIQRQTGALAIPLVGLLAALESLDDDLLEALRLFVGEPPNLTSVDALVEDAHPVAREVRARLLARLDRFGIAHAVLALADGCEPAELPAHLSRVGNLDEVVLALDAAAAPVRYRRVRGAIAELHSLATEFDCHSLGNLLVDDVAVMATMTAAVDVVTAAGLSVDRGDTDAAHLARAIRWRGYGRGPVTAVHRQCSVDIVRGSLRLLAQARKQST